MQSQVLQCFHGAGGNIGRPLLQLVVHHHGADGQRAAVHVAAAGKVRGDGGERQGVRAAAASYEDVAGIAGPGQGVLQQFARSADDGRQPARPASAAPRALSFSRRGAHRYL
ncbi:hypothetical protein NicSoilC5_29980 [Arthrobacter sp. NicSoilC5]|nr:hypothetical protein NicSoilC5_29980 [Arthrobacter sp. NicSoilC5]